jgi:tetratricopeptide (TPR) repeat protein
MLSQLIISLCFLSASSLLFSDSKSAICLVMLIENDEAIIENSLRSVENLIDCLCICNVGSIDRTVGIVKEFMKETHIPGDIVTHAWKDYDYNRTLSIQAAQATLTKFGHRLENSYLLVLDPEMRLLSSPSFRKESLDADAYLILEQNSSLGSCSYNPHLLRACLPWKNLGIAYECWSCEIPHRIAELPSLKIEEPLIEKSKLKTKEKLLLEAIHSEPHNFRMRFHLAQIQASLDKIKEAIVNFENSLQLMRAPEEIWFCKFMVGQCHEKNGEWDKALHWYLEAFQANPNRTESLQKLATYYRLKGMNDLAYIFAKHGSRIPLYEHPLLSPFPTLRQYQFDEELSIVAFYTRFKSEGEEANLHLILRKNVPGYIKEQAYRNELFYIHALPEATYRKIEIALPLIVEGVDERYHPMNPTLYKTNDGYTVICRAVNYTQTGAKVFHTIDAAGVFRTKNFLVQYDADLNLKGQAEIVENLARKRIRSFNLEGLDDCRLFEFQNRFWFTCTTGDTNPTGNFQISLCRLSEKAVGDTILVDKLVPLLGPDPYRCEKNWLPFVVNDELYVVYSHEPLIIYQVDPESGHCDFVKNISNQLDYSSFRGSAAPIAWGNGYLLLVHEVVFHPNYERAYLHRFVFFDSQFNIQQLSNPFYFQHVGVEFCCGMQPDHGGGQLILTLGSEDREAWFCTVPIKTVQSLLKPIPKLIP